jgi:hypothetical protein
LKERRTCRCGRVFWSTPPKPGSKEEVLKYVLCQGCRNNLKRSKPAKEYKEDNLKKDVDALIWLEHARPDLTDKLRSKKPLNSPGHIDKEQVSG